MKNRVVRPRPRPDARRALICLSYAGGGTAPFRGWAGHVPDDVELALVCYPGRERRTGEPMPPLWDQLLDDVALGVEEAAAGRPYVLFGHSMGGAVAAGLASAGLAPAALVLSATRSPSSTLAYSIRPTDSDEQYVEWMRQKGQVPDEVLEHPELREMAVSILRGDVVAMHSLVPDPAHRIEVPTQVLYGELDEVDEEAVRGWSKIVTSDLRIDRLPGGHFYVPEVWERLPEHITALREDG
ncbi:thioesterase II family protein [Allokutzneria albata]|uniref:Thioesterase domain-containing protein n=1 Tax=Allokutzneria albata TaxID=211114 RepID=A0A1H0BW37_ALLAB|nr:alpha/beta fold hydrolase [Allokutzneria albata]SDN49881.1 Thioesterase domain-containing protein [Allokutzneria albata]